MREGEGVRDGGERWTGGEERKGREEKRSKWLITFIGYRIFDGQSSFITNYV